MAIRVFSSLAAANNTDRYRGVDIVDLSARAQASVRIMVYQKVVSLTVQTPSRVVGHRQCNKLPYDKNIVEMLTSSRALGKNV